jgi:hypothetical protein
MFCLESPVRIVQLIRYNVFSFVMCQTKGGVHSPLEYRPETVFWQCVVMKRGRAVEFPLDMTPGQRFSIACEAIIGRGLLFVEQAHKILANKTDEGFR